MTWLRFVAVALGLIAGIALAAVSDIDIPVVVLALPSLAGLGVSICFMISEHRWEATPRWAAVLAAALFTLPIGFGRARSEGFSALAKGEALFGGLELNTELTVQGRISREPDPRSDDRLDLIVAVERFKVRGEGEWVDAGGAEVKVRMYPGRDADSSDEKRYAELKGPDAYGYRVEFSTKYYPLEEPGNPGQFNQATYLAQNDLVGQFRTYGTEISITERSKGNPITEFALAIKKSFFLTYKRTVRAPASRLVAAATLGMRRSLEGEEYRGAMIEDMFRYAGVGHVLAVSGLHVSVIAIVMYGLLSLTRMSPRVFAPVILISLGLFAILTGARPSTVRAVVMNSVTVVAFAYFRYDLRKALYIGLSISSFFILIQTPSALFAPSFLLSFGAVLSIVLVAPPLERCMLRLRGFSLLLVLGWVATILVVTAWRIEWLLSWSSVGGMLGLLWLAVFAGDRLNNLAPGAWRWGLDRLPGPIRSLVVIQLGIQFGMMIPLSSWFFGQFPIAGIFVNMVAIPSVGILIQSGIMTGLIGLIPGIGSWLCIPIGAAATVLGEFFFFLAWLGREFFPFPATPKPALEWVVGYYILGILLLVAEANRHYLQQLVYRAFGGVERRALLRYATPVIALLLLALWPILAERTESGALESVIVPQTRDYPALILREAGTRSAALVNPGHSFWGKTTVFDLLRNDGDVRVRTSIVAGPNPDMGVGGSASLCSKMPVSACYLPFVADSPDQFLQKIGDDYLVEQIRKEKRWAVEFPTAYEELLLARDEYGLQIRDYPRGEPLLSWDGVEIRLPKTPPREDLPHVRRFVYKTRCPYLEMNLGKLRCLIVSDTVPEFLETFIAFDPDWDIIFLPADTFPPSRRAADHPSKTYYGRILLATFEDSNARWIILPGRVGRDGIDPAEVAERYAGDKQVLLTDKEGAITLTPTPNGGIQAYSYLTGITRELAPATGD